MFSLMTGIRKNKSKFTESVEFWLYPPNGVEMQPRLVGYLTTNNVFWPDEGYEYLKFLIDDDKYAPLLDAFYIRNSSSPERFTVEEFIYQLTKFKIKQHD